MSFAMSGTMSGFLSESLFATSATLKQLCRVRDLRLLEDHLVLQEVLASSKGKNEFPSFSRLPIELQSRVADFVSKRDLQALRLAWPVLNEYIRARQFSTVTLWGMGFGLEPWRQREDLSFQTLMHAQLRKIVKRVVFRNVEMMQFMEHNLNLLPQPLTIEIQHNSQWPTPWPLSSNNDNLYETLLGLSGIHAEHIEIVALGRHERIFNPEIDSWGTFSPQTHLGACKSALDRVAVLRLGLTDLIEYEDQRGRYVPLQNDAGELAMFLASCPNLEILVLKVRYASSSIPLGDPDVKLEGILPNHFTWPKLRTLKLQGFVAQLEEVESLLRSHKHTLRTLSLLKMRLLEPASADVFGARSVQTGWQAVEDLISKEMKIVEGFIQDNTQGAALSSYRVLHPIPSGSRPEKIVEEELLSL